MNCCIREEPTHSAVMSFVSVQRRRACLVQRLFESSSAGGELLSVELMETLMTPLNQSGAVCAPVAASSEG